MMTDKVTAMPQAGQKAVLPSAAAVMAITLLVFLPALFGEFVNYDDNRFVVDNPGIRTLDWAMIVAALTRQFSNDYWTPLTWISFAVDYRLWGLNPFGFHLVNILLHGINAGLVVLVADQLLRRCGWGCLRADGERSYPPYRVILVLIGLFWSVHPLRVESVAWIAERKDVLYGMFSLGALYAYLRYVGLSQEGRSRGLGYFAMSLLFFALALMAKPTSVIVPLLLVVADWYPFDRLRRGGIARALGEKVPYIVLAALATLMTITTMTITSPMYSYSQFPLGQRVPVAGHAIFEFCRLLIYPVDIHLFNSIAPVLAAPVKTTAKTAVVIAATGLFFYLGRRWKWLPAAWLAFLIPLVPTLPFFQVGVDVAYSTRHSYLAMVVPSMVLVCLCAAGYGRFAAAAGQRLPRHLTAAAVAVVLCVYVGITEQLIATWKNSGTLWSRVIQVQPIGRAYSYRGFYYLETGQYPAAAADFLMAGQRAEEAGNPAYFNYYALAGDAYNKARSYEEAVAAFSAAIARQPLPNFFYHRGLALQALGRAGEAADDFRAAGQETGSLDFQTLW